jgi:hypothetical protein
VKPGFTIVPRCVVEIAVEDAFGSEIDFMQLVKVYECEHGKVSTEVRHV